MSVYNKIKKYLFLLAIFFSLLILAHLSYVYLYEWANKSPINWWTISVGFVWDSPSVNPLDFGKNPSTDYILRFLYRWLLKYDVKSKKMEWDIANCDLWKNFSKITCYIKENETWSDWTLITKEDILATYKTLKDTDTNKSIKNILEWITIEDKWTYIEFTSKNADVLLLDSFEIPIVKKSKIEDFLAWKTENLNNITSWPYVYDKKEFDEKFNIKKISIQKRDSDSFSWVYISKYVFKYFNDENALMKNEDTLNIVLENSNSSKINLSPRFLEYKYILPQYIWLFLNVEKINNIDLRKFLLFQIESANFDEILPPSLGKKVNNPFFSENKISQELWNKNIVSTLNKLNYFKTDYLITEASKKYDDLLKPQKTSSWIPNSIYFTTPSRQKISFSNNSTEILLSWNVPTWVDAVYINDYKLTSFSPGNTKFYFKAKKEFNTIKIWPNYYSLSFEIWWKKIKKETITIYVYEKEEEINEKKEEISNNLAKIKELSTQEKNKITSEKQAEIDKITKLDNLYFYDKNLNRFKLKLEYSNNWPFFLKLAEKIKNEFKILGIDVEIKEANSWRMEEIVKKWEKSYDLLLTWVNHWMFYYNISPFFHSWQAKQGFNFSKIRSINLDILLEKLKSSELEEDKIKAIEKESLEIFKNEAILKTFYSPYSRFFVDKNIKDILNIDIIPYTYQTYEITKNWYIKEDLVINYTDKNIDNFIKWIKKNIWYEK